MKYWDKIKEPIAKTETSLFIKTMWCIGVIIGASIVGLLAVALYIMFGFFFSLLWNFAVAPVFDVTELTSYTGAVLLFLFLTGAKVVKWMFK
tara:strand:- start:1179 stop:1454 length:276 start_codon:yes stop_codon:yes gene_type:complete